MPSVSVYFLDETVLIQGASLSKTRNELIGCLIVLCDWSWNFDNHQIVLIHMCFFYLLRYSLFKSYCLSYYFVVYALQVYFIIMMQQEITWCKAFWFTCVYVITICTDITLNLGIKLNTGGPARISILLLGLFSILVLLSWT